MTPGTLGYLLEKGYRIGLHCEACNHFAWADIPKLVERLGPLHSYLAADLNHKFRCSKCGKKEVSGRLHPPSGGDISKVNFSNR